MLARTVTGSHCGGRQPSTGIGSCPLRRPQNPTWPCCGTALLLLLDLARAKSSRACPPRGRRVRARPVRCDRISQASGVLMAPCLRACALRQRPGGPSPGRSADRAGGDETGAAQFRRCSSRHCGFDVSLAGSLESSRAKSGTTPSSPILNAPASARHPSSPCWIWPVPNPAAPARPGAGAFAPARSGAARFPKLQAC